VRANPLRVDFELLEQWASLHGRMTEAVRKKFQRMSIVRSRVAADPGGKPPSRRTRLIGILRTIDNDAAGLK
jgi:hypothetical protein